MVFVALSLSLSVFVSNPRSTNERREKRVCGAPGDLAMKIRPWRATNIPTQGSLWNVLSCGEVHTQKMSPKLRVL